MSPRLANAEQAEANGNGLGAVSVYAETVKELEKMKKERDQQGEELQRLRSELQQAERERRLQAELILSLRSQLEDKEELITTLRTLAKRQNASSAERAVPILTREDLNATRREVLQKKDKDTAVCEDCIDDKAPPVSMPRDGSATTLPPMSPSTSNTRYGISSLRSGDLQKADSVELQPVSTAEPEVKWLSSSLASTATIPPASFLTPSAEAAPIQTRHCFATPQNAIARLSEKKFPIVAQISSENSGGIQTTSALQTDAGCPQIPPCPLEGGYTRSVDVVEVAAPSGCGVVFGTSGVCTGGSLGVPVNPAAQAPQRGGVSSPRLHQQQYAQPQRIQSPKPPAGQLSVAPQVGGFRFGGGPAPMAPTSPRGQSADVVNSGSHPFSPRSNLQQRHSAAAPSFVAGRYCHVPGAPPSWGAAATPRFSSPPPTQAMEVRQFQGSPIYRR
eukprot:TRINITY_DN6303_c2_g1_i1.p1 TRINITY_DN6303_c2_g1~~TRINITY_DN6303_c2_g1_i1.p1  ORF type:complete len:447 (+),score=73.74 TRINITY_DN6303_c2_g1_i1:3-1343(+)